MEFRTPSSDGVARNRVFTALADERRRAALRVLDRRSPLRPDELATRLVAELEGVRIGDVPRSRAEAVLGDLHHVHLPVLEDAGLLRRQDDELAPTRHPALEVPEIRQVIDADGEGWNRILAALADERRRIALAVLARSGEPMDRTDLAARVARTLREGDDGPTVEDVLIQLHHTHLPRLEAAGLVAYDADAETVTYEDHPRVDEEWLASGSDDAPRAALSMG